MARRIWPTPIELWQDFKAYATEKEERVVQKLDKNKTLVTINQPMPITLEGFADWRNVSRDAYWAVQEYKDYNTLYALGDDGRIDYSIPPIHRPNPKYKGSSKASNDMDVVGEANTSDSEEIIGDKWYISYSDVVARIEGKIEAYINEHAAVGDFEGRWYEVYVRHKFKYLESQPVDIGVSQIVFNVPRPTDRLTDGEK